MAGDKYFYFITYSCINILEAVVSEIYQKRIVISPEIELARIDVSIIGFCNNHKTSTYIFRYIKIIKFLMWYSHDKKHKRKWIRDKFDETGKKASLANIRDSLNK